MSSKVTGFAILLDLLRVHKIQLVIIYRQIFKTFKPDKIIYQYLP